ncbi:hypothetical protein BH09PLA1_BH09PLA1_29280 [soil metagenome]
MERRLFNFGAVVSSLLFVSTAALWVRSYRVSDALVAVNRFGEYPIQSYAGELVVGSSNVTHESSTIWVDHWSVRGSIWDTWNNQSVFNTLGLCFRSNTSDRISVRPPDTGRYHDATWPAIVESRLVILPMWFLARSFALLPGLWFIRFHRNQRRLARGVCVNCGYDLRTPQRCPECGTLPAGAMNK